MKKNIIIIGSKGYNQNYGGWETFVTELINNYQDKNTAFYIANLTHDKNKHKKEEIINGVHNPSLYCKNLGFVTMFIFTIKSTLYYLKYVKKNKLENVVFLNLGSKVGPLYLFWKPILKKRNIKMIINPDGLEWKREKWVWWIKICFKISERFYMKYADHIVCDAKAIKDYVDKEYKKYNKPSTFIAFGSYLNNPTAIDEKTKELYQKHDIKEQEYYLIVGRFVPENNYETIIKEFMKSNTKKDLVIISNVKEDKFYKKLLKNTEFDKDKRIKFIGTIYNQDILKRIRNNAFAYIHGHSAGGTNPSLLESLSTTQLTIAYDVIYNKEVCKESALFFTKEENDLKNILEYSEKLSKAELNIYNQKAKERIKNNYTWGIIVSKYQELFNKILK